MTQNEFWNVSDNWYQRGINLMRYAQDQTKQPKKREKALILWYAMFMRIQKCMQIAIKIRQLKNTTFKKGGLAIVGENAEEVFVSRKKSNN